VAVIVDTTAVTGDGRVATSTLRAYGARTERAAEVWLADLMSGAVVGDLTGIKAVAAGDLRVVEVIIPEDVPCESVASALWLLSTRGWDATVLVPCHRLGEAHAVLRGTPCRLQSWWIEDGEVSFGGHETP